MFGTLAIALRAIFANRLRSTLTMLGVMIGIAAVISLQAIGEGQKKAQLAIYDTMGANRVMVWPGWGRRGGVSQVSLTMDLEDIEAFAALPNVNNVSPVASLEGRVKYLANAIQTEVVGVLPEYTAVENFTLYRGAMFDAADVNSWSRVAVLGYATAEDLFGARDPVGEEIKINGKLFTVLGVFNEKGAMPWFSMDEQVVVPLTTLWYKLGVDPTVQQVSVQAIHSEDSEALVENLKAVLRQRHPPYVRNEDLFQVYNAAEMQQQREASSKVISTFLVAVGAIALFIGGIGIMNIMLVTVSERTREIGLRKALGATPLAIMGQFLSEAVVLCVLSGLLGVGSGVGIAVWLAKAAETMDFPAPVINQSAIYVAVGVALTVGIVFGTMPAMKAARMDPIRALRHE